MGRKEQCQKCEINEKTIYSCGCESHYIDKETIWDSFKNESVEYPIPGHWERPTYLESKTIWEYPGKVIKRYFCYKHNVYWEEPIKKLTK